jgi:hypothetical protein
LGVTVAVKVTDWFIGDGLPEVTTTTDVAALPMLCVAVLLLAAKFGSFAKLAVMVWDPSANPEVAQVAVPLSMAIVRVCAEQPGTGIPVTLSTNETVDEAESGMLVAGLPTFGAAVTVAVKVTAWLIVVVELGEGATATVVASLLTDCTRDLLLASKFESLPYAASMVWVPAVNFA